MRLAVFGDAHAHAEALDAVLAAADRAGVDALWSLGDMIGGGPDPAHVVRATRERCHVALMGNHDYAATGSVEPSRLGGAAASLELARAALSDDDVAWMRAAGRRRRIQATSSSDMAARASASEAAAPPSRDGSTDPVAA